MSMVRERVFETIKKHDLIKKGAQVIVGISGGPDSVCLLHILDRLAEDLSLQLFAVHVNHGLRGEAADADENWTREFCDSLGIPCRVVRVDAAAYAKEHGLTVEEAGRQLRYAAFADLRQELGAAMIAVAHHADDQAETVLMRILRGTGTYGLAGMEYQRQDGVIRPLLDVSRAEIEAYCEEHDLHPCKDQSNESTDYTRNRIRLELLPYIREHFNPNINEALLRLSAIAGEERAWTDALAEKFLAEHEGLPITALRELSSPLRKRVILLALKRAGLTQDISAVHLEAADRMILEGSVSKQVEFPRGYVLKMGYEEAEITDSAPSRRRRGDIAVKRVSREEYDASSRGTYISADLMDVDVLEIRTRQPGDFIRPFGMNGRKSLQNYFVDRKVPRELRDRLPLLCIGQEVLWVPGFGVSEICRITDETENILSLEYFD